MTLDFVRDRVNIVIGASRGLGASVVNRCLENGLKVIGVGRTKEDAMEDITRWRRTGRFNYVQADITEPSSVDVLKSIIGICNGAPICVIFNAAVIESDVRDDGRLNFEVFRRVNHTGIDGLGYILEVFSDYLISRGGMLVGISSISAWLPPIGGNKIAYPASKAYLDMVLRSLRLLWDKKVHVMIIHLGHIRGKGSLFIPSYDKVAKWVVKAILNCHPPEDICMSTFYCVVYRILRLMPDRFLTDVSKIMKVLR